ncbi:MAG: hypothetical protein Q9160_004140 [Pyrenula sp. 1 TL-2023]
MTDTVKVSAVSRSASKMFINLLQNVRSSPVVGLLVVFGISASSILIYERVFRSALLSWLERIKAKALPSPTEDAVTTDPPLLKKNSSFQTYTTAYGTYPRIRTFYHEHPQADKLPQEARPLPLLVFVHGLGGSLAQLAPIMGSLVNVASCVGIDFPGCGLSEFSPTNWEAYSIEAIATLLDQATEKHRSEGQGVVLIAHSLGCAISATLLSKTSKISSSVRNNNLGFVAICPPASNPSGKELQTYRRLLSIPSPLFNVFRWWDRRGGLNSTSVRRLTGSSAGVDTRKLQMRFNEQSQTPVWRRMAWGTLPELGTNGQFQRGLPSAEIWAGVNAPTFFIAGEADALTKPENVDILISYIREKPKGENKTLPSSPEDILPDTSLERHNAPHNNFADERNYGLETSSKTTINEHRRRVIKSTLLPRPASHALIYDHSTYRTVAGLISSFLISHVSSYLSLGWQLQQLTTSGKWDVKNLRKWQGVVPVSRPIGHVSEGFVFRALKTLREQDEQHTPVKFAREWAGKIFAVVDISHDSPIYDPSQLEKGGIQYHKFPTVSKIPPTVAEVQDFIALVERLRAEIASSTATSKTSPGLTNESETFKKEASRTTSNIPFAIAIHCHYGYNRTGFFIISYLVEKQGYSVQQAIEEFERQRPPGIRHDHFVDTLWVRYTAGLRRAPTLQE